MPPPSPHPHRRKSVPAALAPRSAGEIQVWVRNRNRSPTLLGNLLRGLGITTGLVGAGGLVGVCLWVSAELILRPHPPRWIAQSVPYFSKGWGDMPVQSLTEVEADLRSQGREAGDLMKLSTLGSDRQLAELYLLPVFETRSPCVRDCRAIVELRLYGSHHPLSPTTGLQLLDQIVIQGPPEKQVIDPALHLNTGVVGSTHPLPLVQIKPLQGDGLPGAWVTLTGRWQHQGSPVLYGQVLHVDPQVLRIHSLLNWDSPPGRLPLWHNLDHTGLPELVVNRSLGLEPRFHLYTVASTTAAAVPTRLEEISLSGIPLPPGGDRPAYTDALFLAQHGLWSDAEQRLLSLKTQLGPQWSQPLEQQLQLVSLHASMSQTQAEREWSRPSQKLLALLLDGQWETALQTLDNPENGFATAVLPLLERDSTRIWQRLTASLKVNPHRPAARLWGALLLLAKEDEKVALQWLGPNPAAPIQKDFAAIAARVNPQSPTLLTPAVTASPTSVAETSAQGARAARTDGLFGTARLLATLTAGWRQPPGLPTLQLSQGQRWYEITLQAGHQQHRWQPSLTPPDNTSPAAITAFWQDLGLSQTPTLHLLSPGQSPQPVQVRAVQWQGKTVRLLASGRLMSGYGPWLAITPGHWRTFSQVQGQSLAQWDGENSDAGDRLLATLSNHLGWNAALLAATLQTDTSEAHALAQVRQVDLTGDRSAEWVLTLDAEALTRAAPDLSLPKDVQLVLTSAGDLLYSNLWAGGNQTLQGWLSPSQGAAALVTHQGTTYTLLRWSPQNRQFQP